MSVEKYGTGWRFRISYTDANGDRRWVTEAGFQSKREAQNAERHARVRLDASRAVISGRTTVADYLGAWFDTYERSRAGSRPPWTPHAYIWTVTYCHALGMSRYTS
jgi:hypothetical protein